MKTPHCNPRLLSAAVSELFLGRSMRKLAGLAIISAMAVATPGCHRDYADTRPASAERNQRLTEAELISAAMFVYADRHDGTLPFSLDALKPEYLGQSVDTSFLSFRFPGAKLQGPHDSRVIAAEMQHDTENRFICIYGHREVSMLRKESKR
jgi:hypothetical protein